MMWALEMGAARNWRPSFVCPASNAEWTLEVGVISTLRELHQTGLLRLSASEAGAAARVTSHG